MPIPPPCCAISRTSAQRTRRRRGHVACSVASVGRRRSLRSRRCASTAASRRLSRSYTAMPGKRRHRAPRKVIRSCGCSGPHDERSPMTGLFVTGTDTGVGKTWVTAALLRALAAAGHRCAGMKPVLTGMDPDDDAAMLLAAGNVDVPRSLANPYRFSPAIAPHVAAREAGVAMDLGTITGAFDKLSQVADVVIVEG